MTNRTKVCIYALVGCFSAAGLHLFADNLSPLAAGKYTAEVKKKSSEPKKADNKKDEKKPFGDEKPFTEIVKDMDVIKGLFTFYRKPDENKIYLEIQTNQFDRTFLFAGSIDQSVGERGFYSSQMGGQF